MKAASKPAKSRGFSLVELLVVIAVIGVITLIGVPIITSVNSKATEARDQRNAQYIASLASNAIASGDLTIPAAGSVDEIIDLLVAGVDGTGAFKGTVFRLQNLNAEERARAKTHLTYVDGNLGYEPYEP